MNALTTCTKKKIAGVVFHIEIEKEYDHVNLGFLDWACHQMGFEHRWQFWIRTYISIGTCAILVNGTA